MEPLFARAFAHVSGGRTRTDPTALMDFVWSRSGQLKLYEVYSWPDVLTAVFDGKTLGMVAWEPGADAGDRPRCIAWVGRFLDAEDLDDELARSDACATVVVQRRGGLTDVFSPGGGLLGVAAVEGAVAALALVSIEGARVAEAVDAANASV